MIWAMKGYLVNTDFYSAEQEMVLDSVTHFFSCALICEEQMVSKLESCGEDVIRIMAILDSCNQGEGLRLFFSNCYYASFLAKLSSVFPEHNESEFFRQKEAFDLVYAKLSQDEISNFVRNTDSSFQSIINTAKIVLNEEEDSKYHELLSLFDRTVDEKGNIGSVAIDYTNLLHTLWCFTTAQVYSLVDEKKELIDELIYCGQPLPFFGTNKDVVDGIKINRFRTKTTSQLELLMEEIAKAIDIVTVSSDAPSEYQQSLLTFWVKNAFDGIIPRYVLDRVTECVVK